MDHTAPDSSRHLLRHTVATLAYRAGKVLRDAPPSFAEFHAGEKARTPGQILAHIADLFDWALSAARGKQEWSDSAPVSWDRGTERFFAALEAFDKYLSSEDLLHCSAEQLFQGPVADALTHVGQIAILRRIAGVPIRAENYLTAKITIGRAGADQPAPVMEFE